MNKTAAYGAWIIPYKIIANRQIISVRFLKYILMYLLLNNGTRGIDIIEPSIAPRVKQPTSRPFTQA